MVASDHTDRTSPNGWSEADSLGHGALKGIKVLDLSRILAGPTCTPVAGGSWRHQWSRSKTQRPAAMIPANGVPPYVARMQMENRSDLSAYFMAANRNKRSIALDITSRRGSGPDPPPRR